MNASKRTCSLLLSLAFTWSSFFTATISAKEVNVEAAKEAKPIEVDASLSDDHPAIEEGITIDKIISHGGDFLTSTEKSVRALALYGS